jgi:enolase
MTVFVGDLHPGEILQLRAAPILAVTLTSGDGVVVCAGVPAGASTGSLEPVKLHDDEPLDVKEQKARDQGRGALAVVDLTSEVLTV